VIEKERPAAQNAKQVLDNVFDQLGAHGMDREFNSLYYALEFLPTETQRPLESFALLMASLEAAGVGVILLILQFRELRSMMGVTLAAILILLTTYEQWLCFKMNRFLRGLASSQIAVMIQDIRQQRKRDVRSPDPEEGA